MEGRHRRRRLVNLILIFILIFLGTRFELGVQPFRRNSVEDWDRIRRLAQEARLSPVPSDIYIRYYGNLVRIGQDHMRKPEDLPNVCGTWIYGPPGKYLTLTFFF